MPGDAHAYRLMPWAWLVAWMLTGVGAAISDIYSSPSQGLIGYFVLSAIGWAAACYVTASASGRKSGMAIRLVAWAVAYLVAIPLGLVWMLSQDMPPFLLFVPFVLAGAIGGFASSSRSGGWRLISGAFLGLVFLLFSTVSFYAGYILLLLYSSISQHYGVDLGSSYTMIWVLPEAVFGLLAGFAARWILGFKRVDPTSVLA